MIVGSSDPRGRARPRPSSHQGYGSEPDDILQRIVKLAHALIEMPFAIWLSRPGNGTLEMRAGVGIPDEMCASIKRGGGGLVDEVLATGQPIVIGDLAHDDRFSWREQAEREGWQSALVLPIPLQGQNSGVIQVFSRRTGAIESSLVESLNYLAELASVAVEGARRARDSEQLAHLGKTLSAQPDFTGAMRVITESARELVHADSSTIVLQDNRTNSFVVGQRTPQGPPDVIPRPEGGLTKHIMDTGRPVRIVDTEKDQRVNPELRAQGIRSLIGVRLELAGERFGVLYADGCQPGQFTGRELRLLRTVADLASVALGWTRRLLDPWVVIEQSIEHLFERDAILEAFCRELDRRFGFDFSAVQLVRRAKRLIETFHATGIARRWVARSRHYLHDEADLRDIQADITLARPLRTEIIRGWDWRFDLGIFEEFHHDELVRVFTPLVVVRTPDGKQVDDWLACFEHRIIHHRRWVDRQRKARQKTVLEMVPREDAASLEIEVIGTVEAGYHGTGHELGPAQALELVSFAAGQAGDIRKTLLRHVEETIVEQARRVAGADSASMHFSFDATSKRYLNEVRAGGLTPSFLAAHPPRPGGLGDHAIRDREPKILPDLTQGDDEHALKRLRPELAALGIRTMAAFPLLAGAEVGVLYLHFRRSYRVRGEEIRWVQLLASRAADAIRQATAYTESQERARQLAYLQTVVQDLVKGLGEEELRPKIARNTLNTLAADVVTIYEFNASEHRFVTPPAIAGRLRRKERMRTAIGENDAPVLLLEHGEDLFVSAGVKGHQILDRPGRHRSGQRNSFVAREGVKSCAGVLLKVGDETVGVMFINYRRAHRFSLDDQRIAGALASAAAIAVKNQRLLAKLQQDLLTITHQTVAPLLAISARLENATTGDPAVAPSRQFWENLEEAHAQSQDVLMHLSGILSSFARETGQANSFNAERFDALGEVRRVCEHLRRTNPWNNVRFSFETAPELPVICFDKTIFKTVIYNLLHNALKYAEPSSEVRIVCRTDESRRKILVVVCSVGERIEKEESERIFEKFARGRILERTGRRHSGVGLGLWVARGAMRAAGGDLRLELSAAEPQRACFVVEIPLSGRPVGAGSTDPGTLGSLLARRE